MRQDIVYPAMWCRKPLKLVCMILMHLHACKNAKALKNIGVFRPRQYLTELPSSIPNFELQTKA